MVRVTGFEPAKPLAPEASALPAELHPVWRPHQESNLNLGFRKPSFCPLNYGDTLRLIIPLNLPQTYSIQVADYFFSPS